MNAEDRRLAAQRPCGDCQACCELIGIKELGKPYACKCKHQCTVGCGIYAQRPDSCRDYYCIWKLAQELPDEARPDLCGVLLTFDNVIGGRRTLLVMETRPDAIKLLPPEVAQWIDDYGQQPGKQVLLMFYGDRLNSNFPIAAEYPHIHRPNPKAGRLDDHPNFFVLEPPP